MDFRKYLAELVGTYMLVFFGTGAVVVNSLSGGAITHLGVATTFGLIVMVVIYSIGNRSGAHLNPAVTLGFSLSGEFPIKDTAPYIIAQFAGAFLASLSLWGLFPNTTTFGETLPSGTVLQSFLLEVILTFFLMFVIISVATGNKVMQAMAGVVIGMTVFLEAIFAGPISGASMNPARSLAPALVSGNTEAWWLYIAAPILGALLAIPIWKYIRVEEQA